MAAVLFFIRSQTEMSTLSKSASHFQTLTSISCYLFHFACLLRWLPISIVPHLSDYIWSQKEDAGDSQSEPGRVAMQRHVGWFTILPPFRFASGAPW